MYVGVQLFEFSAKRMLVEFDVHGHNYIRSVDCEKSGPGVFGCLRSHADRLELKWPSENLEITIASISVFECLLSDR